MTTNRGGSHLEGMSVVRTMLGVAKDKKKNADRHKPRRIVGIPEPFAVALEGLASEQFNTLAEQVKIAVREYLDKHGRLPKPKGKPVEGG